MLKTPIAITAFASVSALGHDETDIWRHYLEPTTHVKLSSFGQWVCAISDEDKQHIQSLLYDNKKYRSLDDSVIYALFAARMAHKKAAWQPQQAFGINIGSSRGATGLFEHYHADFMADKKLSPLSSPTTTLGNIASWVAHDCQPQQAFTSPAISHSITCSSALHAIINACAWLQSGMCDQFMVGGSEAPLTPFTVAQMQALGVYASANDEGRYPCRALDMNKSKNGMVLGEAAAIPCLQTSASSAETLGLIEGIGYATEVLQHNTSISQQAKCLQASMRMAMVQHDVSDIDVIITHTPGTIRGDQAEMDAIKQVFGEKMPAITTNKWKLGHTLATSGMLSIELALLMGKHQQFIPVPFILHQPPQRLNRILVNAVGFGGNAVSILLNVSRN